MEGLTETLVSSQKAKLSRFSYILYQYVGLSNFTVQATSIQLAVRTTRAFTVQQGAYTLVINRPPGLCSEGNVGHGLFEMYR